MIHVKASVKKDHSWNRNTCISENDEYLESIPTDMTNNISTNVVRSMSINSNDKKVREKIDYYILHRILLVTILIFIIAITWYHPTKNTPN